MATPQTALSLSLDASLYLLHHVFLPPKLPQRNDYNSSHELTLLNTVIHALHGFKAYVPKQQEILYTVIMMLSRLRATCGPNGIVDERKLYTALEELGADGGALPIYIHCQNAALLMTNNSNAIHVETFELSPRNEAVNSTKGRLQRQFPGPALVLDRATFDEPKLRRVMSETLSNMSQHTIPGTKPQIMKKGQLEDENRDTTDPKIVTEFFMTFLRPRCTVLESVQILKNTREEVLWLDCSLPWRRSSLWLLVRVTLQLTLKRLCTEKSLSDDLYKHFMVYYCSVIMHASSGNMCDEDQYIMKAKVAHRLRKLDLSYCPAWFPYVQTSLQEANNAIQKSWCNIMGSSNLQLDTVGLKKLDFGKDVGCSLPELDKWIRTINERGHTLSTADFQPPSNILHLQSTEIPSFSRLDDPDYRDLSLAAVENWVSINLEAWLQRHIGDIDTSSQLSTLIIHYYDHAITLSSGNPEAVSIMHLTILELWIALDKAAIHHHPLIGSYDSHLPMSVYESLVLPYRSQLERLTRAEAYMRLRQDRVQYPGSNIFQDFGTRSAFSVKYFDQSVEHQTLLGKIEKKAGSERDAKTTELTLKQKSYRDLITSADQTSCEYVDYFSYYKSTVKHSRHSDDCARCAYKASAESISIDIHEWPLPTNSLQAKSTVFELNVPRQFAFWRDTTAFLILDVLRFDYLKQEKPRARFEPQTYRGLASFFTQTKSSQRISLLSQDKPRERTHRGEKLVVSVREEDVCLENGMNLRYFDQTLDCFVVKFEATTETATACTYELPCASSSLQRFMFRPANDINGPSPNTVIALQEDCPGHLALGEYKALCSMPYGIETQWVNILHQLAMPSVVFRKDETCLFILQIIRQAGPASKSSTLRAGHAIIDDHKFVEALLTTIKTSATKIKENWESAQELGVLIFLTQRILSLSASSKIHDLCLSHLSEFRTIAFDWATTVRETAGDADSDTRRNDLMARSAHLSLICVATFDCEGTILQRVLRNTADAAIFIQSCMIIHDRTSLLTIAPGSLFQILYYRWRILAYRCHSIIRQIVIYDKATVMEIAVRAAWAAYRKGSPWSLAPGGGNHWLVTQMTSEPANGSLFVHYNILTGELLINGMPLSRLPSSYERDSTYRTLFGQSVVEVMPSEVPGMQFSGQRKHLNQTIHLGREPVPGAPGLESSDLCVRAVKEDQVWEFVPARLFIGTLPDAFIETYAHWYDFSSGNIEFRTVNKPWESSSSHWWLQRQHQQGSWCLVQGDISLVSLKSQTAQALASILEPIERASRLHCKLHTLTLELEIELPRLRLNFDLRSGSPDIRSRQYRGMSIDANQSLATMVGLRNKLLLIHKNGCDRKVLIPEGDISWEKQGRHVAVQIGWQRVSSAHVYVVDDQLGRLTDNGSLQSKFLLCYLHAVTSFCVPDPLIKKTGTEQALSILRSASARSFSQLQPENTAILARIAGLAPKREYYPKNEQVMQSISWQQGLGSLAHHNGFYEQVLEIFEQNSQMRMFYPESQEILPTLPTMSKELLQRDKIRSSLFRTSGFGAEDHTVAYDFRYTELGRKYESKVCSRIFTLCRTLYDGIPSTQAVDQTSILSTLWAFLSSAKKVHGSHVTLDKKINYDAAWLLEPAAFISTNWFSIRQSLCSVNGARPNKYQVMIWLSTLAFSDKIDMNVLRVFAALYIIPDMAAIEPPRRSSFQPAEGYGMNQHTLESQILRARFDWTPESSLPQQQREGRRAYQSRIHRLREENRSRIQADFMASLRTQWPTEAPYTPDFRGSPNFGDYFDTSKSMELVREKFLIWFCNIELRKYLASIASVLSAQSVQLLSLPPYPDPPRAQSLERNRGFVSLDDLLDTSLDPPPRLTVDIPRLALILHASPGTADLAPRLLELVALLEMQAASDYETQYVHQLQGSTESLQNIQQAQRIPIEGSKLKEYVSAYVSQCEAYSRMVYLTLASRLMFSGTASGSANQETPARRFTLKTLAGVNFCPRLSPELFLEQLTRQRWRKLSTEWKHCFIAYGCSITAVQWAKRLYGLIDHREDFIRELQNPGHMNWNPHEFPESLLLEVENGLLIRDVQEQIARQMRSPAENAVMQLNMGEGKSSVIVPIVAAGLADGSCLVRVLVAKPQSQQMFEMLVSKLGGLLGRRVYHLPVTRSLKINKAEAEEIERMCKECMAQGGVLLVQPEHILSLKLMCVESFTAGKEELGRCLLRTLEFFRTSSRDIVDESDENFSVKFELIYTMGSQRSLELSPERWIMTQHLLDLVRRYAPAIKAQLPQSIEVESQGHGSFPRTRLLYEDAIAELFGKIADHIYSNGIGSLPVSRQPNATRKAVLSYMFKLDLSEQEIAAVENESATSFWTDSNKDLLLLLRGLLAGGVIASCFGQKRWRVNYGPHHARKPPTKLSVPYRAKDNPAPRSEFSHPDVVIVLTCLSYYYAGLSDEELFAALSHLIKSDQADIEYQMWVDDAPLLAPAYRQLNGINLQDRHHCLKQIFPNLQFSKAAVDYYLAHIVFPKEMKEFPYKLSASGWDIGEVKAQPTAGFSGTNDSRVTLPLSVKQLDLPEQKHTNALVLEYLLRPENSVANVPVRDTQCSSDAQALLDLVVGLDPPVQVILDVGAQILELTNLEVAESWLKMIPNQKIQAVVFVNDSDEICVVDRTRLIEPLQVSPFANQLDACLVFLDEAHTRGIDLRLPQKYRAAATLGAGITKDKLVQACMRMRKLGKGQSVIFCISQEIKTKIRTLVGKPAEYAIQVSDVLRWAISETWIEMQRGIPLWAVQGVRFERQDALWRKIHSGGQHMSKEQADGFLEPECQTIEKRYRPRHEDIPSIAAGLEDNDNVQLILGRCREFANVNFASTQLQEEQERQLAPEIEQERQIQRPPAAEPERHQIHQDLRHFILTGVVKKSSKAFMPAFQALRKTSAVKYLDVAEFTSGLLITSDFARTVQVPKASSSTLDDYQRPVQWILTSTVKTASNKHTVKDMVIISPFEANELQSDIRKPSAAVTLHIYAPRQNRSYSPLDRLELYSIPLRENITLTIPTSLRIELNLFAGQLYISSYQEYLEICEFLGLASAMTSEGVTVAADGFIIRPDAPFTQSPLKFFKIIMSQIRRDGQEIDKTHFGKILDGKLLSAEDFQDIGDNLGLDLDLDGATS
ncbi:hypothetical protein BJX70DRAFT_404369 [Aspergillus crustosus]